MTLELNMPMKKSHLTTNILILLLICVFVIGCQEAPPMVVPELTEEEILDMSDDDLIYYGTLVRSKRLVDVSTPYNEEITYLSADKSEIAEDDVRSYFASRISADYGDTPCVGEYVIETDDGFMLRRYYIRIIGGDYGLFDSAMLFEMDWIVTIGDEVKWSKVMANSYLKEVELPDD